MENNARSCAGYAIIRALLIDARHALVIGHNAAAPAPYVCWDRTRTDDGTGPVPVYSYDTGAYCQTFRQAMHALAERIMRRYDYLPLEGGLENE